jgi:chemotaxis receptor (MCP) glutamine deamidase CheD
MNATSVRFLQSAIVSSGLLKIENIGAGVGVILFSPEKKIAAGLHIMAPSSRAASGKNPVMYADTAIPHIMEELKQKGVGPPLSVAVAGGSVMMGGANGSSIGQKVTDAVQIALRKSGLTPKINKTGGAQGRNMVLDVDAGKIRVA